MMSGRNRRRGAARIFPAALITSALAALAAGACRISTPGALRHKPDRAGQAVRPARPAAGVVTRVYPDGSPAGNQDGAGREVIFTYDSRGLLIRVQHYDPNTEAQRLDLARDRERNTEPRR